MAGSTQGGVSGSTAGGSAGGPSGGAGSGLGGASGSNGAAGSAAVSGASGASGGAPLGGTSGGGAGGTAGSSGTGGSSGSGGKGGAGGTGGGTLCATRTGGALIDMTIAGESLRLWITNTAFINEMSQNVGREAPRQPILDLLDGQDCDPQYTWHANPSTARFATAQMDICAAWPSVVEDNKDLWVNSDWCPEMAHVVAVTRR
jgi:hypothetical protein